MKDAPMKKSTPQAPTGALLPRRSVLQAGAAAMLAATPLFAPADEAVAARLREGGVVLALRHALAPGTFDPPGFRLGDCTTQRNLDGEGRAQAARLGQWARARQLLPARVRSSPWCRCMDTAQLAFGQPEAWDALASPTQADSALREQRLASLRAALRAVPSGRFEAWVTHQFVLQDLAGVSTAPAEALVLAPGNDASTIVVLARATLY